MLRKLGLRFSGIEINLWFLKLHFGSRREAERPQPDDPKGGDAATPAPNGNQPAVNLINTPFELALRAAPRVDQLLRDRGCEHAAIQAIEYLLSGHPAPTDAEKRRTTYRDIREACLKLILETLQQYHQRATYGAVAGIVGGIPQGLMKDRPQNVLHSWVVSSETHMPTGYAPSDKHVELEDRTIVLESPNQLRQWLADTQ